MNYLITFQHGPPSHLPEGSSGYNVVAKVFDKRRKKAKKAVGWDIGPLSGGMLWAAKTMMSRRVKAHEGLGFDAGSLSKGNLWRATLVDAKTRSGRWYKRSDMGTSQDCRRSVLEIVKTGKIILQ